MGDKRRFSQFDVDELEDMLRWFLVTTSEAGTWFHEEELADEIRKEITLQKTGKEMVKD